MWGVIFPVFLLLIYAEPEKKRSATLCHDLEQTVDLGGSRAF